MSIEQELADLKAQIAAAPAATVDLSGVLSAIAGLGAQLTAIQAQLGTETAPAASDPASTEDAAPADAAAETPAAAPTDASASS